MPISRRTKFVAASLITLIALAIGAKLMVNVLYPQDLRSQLAHILGVRPDVLWINLPPANNRRPGSAFVLQRTLLPIDSVRVDPDELSTGSEFELGWVNSTGSKVNAGSDAGILSLLYGDSGEFKVDLRAKNCRSIELPIDKLKKRLLGSEEVKAQAAQGRDPLVVVRSYEGVVTLRISRTGSTSAQAWQKAKSSTKEAAGFPNSKISVQGESDDSLEVTFKESIVFAYEMVAAKLITTHLGSEPNDVQFTPVFEPAAKELTSARSTAVAPDDPRRWALATVAVSDYPKTAWLQQPWNRHSAAALESSLKTFGPTLLSSYRTDPEQLSTAKRLVAFAEEVGRQAKSAAARLIVFYYVGHTVTTRDGHVLLLQSGITPQLLKQVGAEQVAAPIESSFPGDQALDLEELHRRLKLVGIPFVLLLDGCMDNASVRQAIVASGFRYDPAHPTLYYVGSEPLTQRLISQVGRSLSDFGARRTYFKDDNPVIFAAKPGTLALLGEDPHWQGASPLAPLASKVRRLTAPAAGENVNSLAELLSRVVDMRQGVGQIELSGSITWSDFSRVEDVARPFVAVDRRVPVSDATTAVAKRFEPGIGQLEGFFFSSADRSFYVMSQGNDWKLWRWSEVGGKRLISSDITFPMVSGTQSGQVYLHYDKDKTLARIEADGPLARVKQDLYVQRMAVGRSADELLVASEAAYITQVAPVFSVRSDKVIEVGRMRTSGLLALTPIAPDGIAFTRDGSDTVFALINGQEIPLASGLLSPSQLVTLSGAIYCLTRNKTSLYRISGSQIAQAALTTKAGLPLLKGESLDGMQATGAGTLLITDGASIVELRPDKLAWTPVQAR
jgi:hypothetical protein